MEKIYTIVTGATSGIGREIAKQLHLKGQHLILANRNQKKAELLKEELMNISDKAEIDLLELDLSSFASIKAFANEVKKNYKRIDVLINNAGVLMKNHDITQEGFEMTIGVNYLGTYLLTEQLIGLLTKSKKPKIIFLSSIVAKFGKCQMTNKYFKNNHKGFLPYFNSKLALMMYAKELQENYRSENVIVKAVHPGVVYTHIWKWKTTFGKYLEKIQAKIMKNAEEGARMPVIFASTDEYDLDNSLYYKFNAPLKLPKKIEDAEFRKNFIDYTKKTIFEIDI